MNEVMRKRKELNEEENNEILLKIRNNVELKAGQTGKRQRKQEGLIS